MFVAAPKARMRPINVGVSYINHSFSTGYQFNIEAAPFLAFLTAPYSAVSPPAFYRNFHLLIALFSYQVSMFSYLFYFLFHSNQKNVIFLSTSSIIRLNNKNCYLNHPPSTLSSHQGRSGSFHIPYLHQSRLSSVWLIMSISRLTSRPH